MNLRPVECKRLGGDGIALTWSDETTQQISSKTLRENCPCAGCKERRGDTSHAKPITGKPGSLKIVESSLDEELRLDQIWAVGQYAIGFRWGDGHDTGIYTYQLLYELGKNS